MFLHYNTREQNSEIIAQNTNEKFVNQQVKQRQREISNLPKGIVNKRKLSMNFNFPETNPPPNATTSTRRLLL